MRPIPATHSPATSRVLAEIGRAEAARELSGDARLAGPAIEPYLAVLREALNENGSTTRYSNTSIGFNWCCAFVYYCCLQAGFRFSPKPVPDYRYTLGAVPAWHHWAVSGGFFHPVSTATPEPGDIALFNRVFDGQPLDHIGIVLDGIPDAVLTAEGNNSNRTGIFLRPYSAIEGYVRLPEDAPHPGALDSPAPLL